MIKDTLYVIAGLLFCSCCETANQQAFDKDKVKQEVIQMLAEYHEDIRKEGLMAEFKYLDSSENFFWVPPGYTSALTYDSVKSILEKNAKAIRSVSFNWKVLHVFPLSDEIADYWGIVEGIMTDTAGIESKPKIIESGTVIKRTDGWKLLSGQSALLAAAVETGQ